MMNSCGIAINGIADEEKRSTIAAPVTKEKLKTIKISLKQWRMFHAVIDSDGFAEAAEKLHVSQSSISHALAKLQEQLELPLLTLKGRKAQITEDGKALLERSRELLRCAVELEEFAESLRLGSAPEIRLLIDGDFPTSILMRTLCAFSTSSQEIRLSVKEGPADRACQALLDNTVDFAVTSRVPPGYVSCELLTIEYVPVAHITNPLFSLERQVNMDDLKSQRPITVVGGGDYMIGSAGHASNSLRPWTVGSHVCAIEALCERLGYAWLPKYKLQPWLEKNILAILPMGRATHYMKRLHLVTGSSVRGNSKILRFGDAMRLQSTTNL